jgi:hypothetical protein
MFIQTIDGDIKQFYFTTKLSDNIEVLQNGYLRCNNVIMGRTGTQQYSTKELGIQTSDGKNYIVNVNRHEEDVFHPDTLKSIEGMSVTIGHPKDDKGNVMFVTTKNVDNLSVGTILNVRREGDNLVGDIVIDDERAIEMVVNKEVRELSLGYDTKYELDGEEALKQTNIIVNHLAIVEKGRAGNARIVDEANLELEKGVKPLEKEGVFNKILRAIGVKKAILDDNTELDLSIEEATKVETPKVEEPTPTGDEGKEVVKDPITEPVAVGDDGKSVRTVIEVSEYENDYSKEKTVTQTQTVTEYHEKTQEEIEKEKENNMITLDEAMKKIVGLEPLKGTEAYQVAMKAIDGEMVEAGLGSILKKDEEGIAIFKTVTPTSQTSDGGEVQKFKAQDFLNGIQSVYKQFNPRELDKVSKNAVDRMNRITELSSIQAVDLIKEAQ